MKSRLAVISLLRCASAVTLAIRCTQLCTAIQHETDSKKLTELAAELNALLLPKIAKRSGDASPRENTTQQQ
jgi:hypothetical protein